MRIVQVTPTYPPTKGGMETHVEAISTRLADRGHDVTVVSADADVGDRREVRSGVDVRRCRSVAPGRSYRVAPEVARVLGRLGPDIIHAHHYHRLTLPIAAIAVEDADFVATPHYHGGSESGLRDVLLELYRPIGGRVLRRADTVVAVSEWERNQLARDFGIDATVVPNGIEVDRFANAEPYDNERPYLLCVGRLVEYKGVQHVIRGMTMLPDYDLIVAGSGPYHHELQQIALEAGVSDRVTFLGYVDDDALPSLYAGADVYVTLSEFESFGITVGEALATETPCVVARNGALKDWTNYDGVIGIGDRDTATISDAVEEARTVAVGSTAVPRWSTTIERLESIYDATVVSEPPL